MKNLLAAGINDVFGNINAPNNNRIYTDDVNTSLGKIVSFGIQIFFFVAALSALIYLLMGAFDWIASNGEKEKISKAQNKIQSAAIGLVLIVVVLVVLATLEQIVLKGAFCVGLTCAINLPTIGN